MQTMNVYQINENHGRAGWVGQFVLATEERRWGIIGFVSVIKDHETQERAYIRLKHEDVDLIGETTFIPVDYAE